MLIHDVAWWAKHVLGLDDAGGPWYLFWSGFASFFTGTGVFVSLGIAGWTFYRKAVEHHREHLRLLREHHVETLTRKR